MDSFFEGSDGPAWDDDRLVLFPEWLPAGTSSATIGISKPSPGDCLAWAYAALEIKL